MLYLLLIDTEEGKRKFVIIHEKYRLLMLKAAFDVLEDIHEAEDAVQEAFIKVARNMKCVGEVDSDKTKRFLITVVKNAAKDMLRKNSSRSSHEMYVDEMEHVKAPVVYQETDIDCEYLKDNMLAGLNSNVELLAYREAKMIDPITGSVIDIPHWAVSTIAHFNQDYYVIHFPIEMASWGGDLQTLAADVALDAPSTTNELKIEGYINSVFPMGDTSFGYSDLLSDVDAINCYKKLSENYISEIFESYYINMGASKRYSLFLEHYNDNFRNKINELLPDAYFDDGTIELEQKLLYCAAGVILVEDRLSDRNASDDLWPSQVQVQILKECFYEYIYRQSILEWEN